MSIEAISAVLNLSVKPSSHKFVLFVMANFANEEWCAYPSIPTIARLTSLDSKTVRFALHGLVADGYLEDTGEKAGVTHQIPVYRLARPEPSRKREAPENGTLPFLTERLPIFPGKTPEIGRQTLKDTKSKTKNKTKNKTPPIVPPKGDGYTDKFVEFWQTYPVKRAKGGALKAWKRLGIEKHGLADTVIASIAVHQSHDPQWQVKEFIPYPATYLNQRRWEDELEIPRDIPWYERKVVI